ncbi:CU044_5270 family protein [Streptomyces sp. RY43-2]|uniref:CU044_5270 family protein n=1 Tax=Streptomyces macrolidinus TaxID=2952607 RepID=A0ABT0Z694_9ACTN|nr:CU044_5270 family protein [Streptomyces macrolidinus]MCN9239286.1 CU044_5270 family protein [Streptomyces macrolidinus]
MNITPRRRTHHRSEETERADLADLLPPPPVPDLGPDRGPLLKEALLREAALAEPTGRVSVRATRPRPRPRSVRVMVPTIACAMAVCGVVAVNLTATPASRTTTAIADGGTPRAPEARQLLDRVALAAAESEQPAVRADQFVYVESKVAYAGQSAAGGPVTMAPAHTRQVWLSADGSRSGLLREAGRPDSPLGPDAPVYTLDGPGATPRPSDPDRAGGPSIDNPTYTYVASLPTDPDALLKLIRNETRGQGQDPDQRAFTAIGDLLAETWAPPRVSAALYRAAAKIPGVTVIRAAADATGREGVAVARTAHGQQTQWIFDRTTYAFLGERSVLTEPGDAGPAGTVVGTSAILTKAAVDRAGAAPGKATA